MAPSVKPCYAIVPVLSATPQKPALTTDVLRNLQQQDRAVKRLAFWSRACLRTSFWNLNWSPMTDRLTNVGEDLLATVTTVDAESQLSLAATCRSLRGLVFDRLQAQKNAAMRTAYLTGVMFG